MAAWEEVTQAKQNKRRELILKGSEIASRIKAGGIDKRIFSCTPLNFVEISDAGLEELPGSISNLASLLNLTLRSNQLTALPDAIGELTKLQFLDASRNVILRVPDSFGNLSSLHTLDLSQNKLSEIPESCSSLHNLAHLNVSRNSISSLVTIFSGDFLHLSEILASHNQIESISHDVGKLEVLRKLDLSENKLQDFPADLARCPKLKELFLMENPVKDRRLKKLIQQERGTKPILEYISSHGTKAEQAAGSKSSKDKKGKRKKRASQSKDGVEELSNIIEVLSLKNAKDPLEVKTCKSVVFVRPYIACCIVHNLDLASGNRFKHFLTAQTKLHDGPLCGKRTIATIATHDLDHIKGPLVYEGKRPRQIELTPLGKNKSATADVLMKQLNQEAEDLRKEMKRNAVSGIHKYLSLLAGQEMYPCLMDALGHVISFPPITNADLTKCSKSTKSILIEVTSSEDLGSCKKVLQALLTRMLELNLGSSGASEETPEEESNEEGIKRLTVEQVRVVNDEGELRVVYPSKIDLTDLSGIEVLRQ